MEYRISIVNDSILIKVLGPFNKTAVYSAGVFLKPLLKGVSTKITMDIDDLKDEREMVFHMGLVNAFRKVIDQVGGKLFVKTDKPAVREYLRSTGLDKIFDTTEKQLLN
jgi:anti-anti-sigma regulatory factor